MNWKEFLDLKIVLLIISVIIVISVILFLSFFSLERISCQYESDCPTGYQCPTKPIGGDFLCHKSCKWGGYKIFPFTSSDCPPFQVCRLVERIREDMVESVPMCFPWLKPIKETVPPGWD